MGLGAGLYAFVSPWVAALGLLAVPIVLQLFRKFDRSFVAYYLMHDYICSAQKNGAYPVAIETWLATFNQAIATGLQRDVDEVVVLNHLLGAYLAVSVLAMCCGWCRLMSVVRR